MCGVASRSRAESAAGRGGGVGAVGVGRGGEGEEGGEEGGGGGGGVGGEGCDLWGALCCCFVGVLKGWMYVCKVKEVIPISFCYGHRIVYRRHES